MGKLPELEKLKSIVGGELALTEDVSLLPRETQVALKMLELELASFVGYEVVLQNAVPFREKIKSNLEAISRKMRLRSVIFPILQKREKALLISILRMANIKS